MVFILTGCFMNQRIFAAIVAVSFFAAANVQAITKVACVGNSITEGYGIWDKKKYPEHLQDMLGSDYKVENFGHSSQMFRKNSNESYWKSAKFTAAYNMAPDIVVIELGTNDSKYYFNGPENYYGKTDRAEMLRDYEALIDTFAHQPQAPKIYATLQPYANKYDWFITDTAIVNQINPIIKEAAENKGATLIDLHAEFNKPEWLLEDNVHPNETGAKELAKIIAKAILSPSLESSSSVAQTSSSAELAKSSSSEIQVASSSSNTDALHSAVASQTKLFRNASTIFIEHYTGHVAIFDLNGNLIKKAYCNGSLQIRLQKTGAYIAKFENKI